MNRKFLKTTTHKDDRHRDPAIKATLRNCRSVEEAEDIEDIVGHEPMSQNHWSWDHRRTYVANSAQRWLKTQAIAGRHWDDVRSELIEKVGHENADYMVEKTEEIDGKVHVVNSYFGPTPLKDYYQTDCVVVLPNGVLKHYTKKSTAKKAPKQFFHFEKETLWFRFDDGTVFHAPLNKVREPDPTNSIGYRNTWPYRGKGIVTTGAYRALPFAFHNKEILMSEARQASSKKVPQEVDNLCPIEGAKPKSTRINFEL